MLAINIEMLKSGYYISGHFDEFYIPGTSSYKKRNHYHRYLLFGYNNKKTFTSAAYLSNGHYSIYDLRYDDYMSAIRNCCADNTDIHYYKINSGYQSSVNILHIKTQLENYMYRECSSPAPKYIYGMYTWECLADYIATRQYGIDLRYARVFMEHHAIMHTRIDILTKLSYIEDTNLHNAYRSEICIPDE